MKSVLQLSILLSASLSAQAADWPQWRGPEHNGISQETDWQTNWGAQGPKVAWQATLGTGFSSVTVSHGRVYSMGNTSDADTIFCFNEKDGSPLWKYSYPAKLDPHMFEGGPTCTPTVDGNQVFIISRKGLIHCLAADTGKVLWETNVTTLEMAVPQWGFAGSAYLDKNLVIFNVGASGIALDRNTGQIAWQSAKSASAYSTPVPCMIDKQPVIVMAVAQEVAGIDPATGMVRWRYPWKTSYEINAADAIVSGNQFFISSGYGHGAAMFEVKAGAPATVWETKLMRNHINSCVLVDGYLYGFDGDAPALDGNLRCLDFKTGSVHWSEKLPTGSLIVANHKLIVLTSKGELIVAETSPEGFKAISRASVLTGKCWTPPTLANGKIYCRNNAPGELVCLDVAGK